MTDKRRREIAHMLRRLLDQGLHRKEALLEVRKKFAPQAGKLLAQSSVYKYCKQAGVSTK